MQISTLNTFHARSNNSFGATHYGIDDNGMRKSRLIINNPRGIHSRPSANIVKLTLLTNDKNDVFVEADGRNKNSITGSILSLLMMGLTRGEEVFLETQEDFPVSIHNAIADCFEASDDDENSKIAEEFIAAYKSD